MRFKPFAAIRRVFRRKPVQQKPRERALTKLKDELAGLKQKLQWLNDLERMGKNSKLKSTFGGRERARRLIEFRIEVLEARIVQKSNKRELEGMHKTRVLDRKIRLASLNIKASKASPEAKGEFLSEIRREGLRPLTKEETKLADVHDALQRARRNKSAGDEIRTRAARRPRA